MLYYRLKGDKRGILGVLIDKRKYLEAMQLLEGLNCDCLAQCLDDSFEMLFLHTTKMLLPLIIGRNLQVHFLHRIALVALMNENLISIEDRRALSEFLWNEVICSLDNRSSLHPAIVNTCLIYLIKYAEPKQREDRLTRLFFELLTTYPIFGIVESVEAAMESFGLQRFKPWLKLFCGAYADAIEEILLSKDPYGSVVLETIVTSAVIDDDKKAECLKCFMSLRQLSLVDPTISIDFSNNTLSQLLDSDRFKDDLFQVS